mmetsp:Transcript_19972/g.29446  ORF Transcript_19972/g.29446 Transcript_19972/m.29446 type:complete len:567 (-) Transcript_19972:218-1918(-)
MVKRQKEKQYESSAEHRINSKLRSGNSQSSSSTRPLPFDCCALTLTPYTNPVMRVCDSNGILFENSAIFPYIMKYKADPVTGKGMTSKDLITLQMDKDEETGRWQCPVLNKPFLNHTKIAAVIQNDRSTANVYSYEAVYELNIKAKSYLDLISGEKFDRKKDVVILQDPSNLELIRLRDINHFKHTDALRKQNNEQMNGSNNVKLSVTASRIIDKMKRKREDEAEKEKKAMDIASKDEGSAKKLKIFTDELTGVSMTSGKASGSFTSTAMNVNNDNSSREATYKEIMLAKFAALKKLKKKGFVKLNTSHGVIDVELRCDIVPKTCMNFIGLCEKKAYDGTSFHRSIRNFMIQGGKPSEKGQAETSLWGDPFEDEFDDRLKHVGSGVLSMANAGPGTNKRQFFITFKSAPHLDRKHNVFGRIIKGMNVLSAMESIATDKKDRPIDEIKIISAEVIYSPIEEAGEKERLRIQKRADAKRLEKEERRSSALGIVTSAKTISSSDANANDEDQGGPIIGKYLPQASVGNKNKGKKEDYGTEDDHDLMAAVPVSRLPPPPKKTTFGDFSGW